jgi:hypothetical protein
MIIDDVSKIYYTIHSTLVWDNNIQRSVIGFIGIKSQLST